MSFQDYTDESGVVRLRAKTAGGGSQLFQVVRVPIAFNTPGLTNPSGPLDIYTPTDGDVIFGLFVTIPTTAWDGTTPTLSIGPPGDLGHYVITGLGSTDSPTFSGDTTTPAFTLAGGQIANLGAEILHSDPIQAQIDDSAGGDPGSTQGAGAIVLLIATS